MYINFLYLLLFLIYNVKLIIMGICTSNSFMQKYFFCNSPPIDNNIIIINLDKNETHINSKQNENKEIHSTNKNNTENNNKIVIYKIQSQYKSKLKSSIIKSCNKNNDSIINNNKTNELSNDKIDKLIHFTNFNSISVTTNSIIK